MGKIKTHVQDWLFNVGYDLGYDDKNSPELKDLKVVKDNRIPIWEYYGFETQEEYWEARFSQTHDQNDEPEGLEDIEPIEY